MGLVMRLLWIVDEVGNFRELEMGRHQRDWRVRTRDVMPYYLYGALRVADWILEKVVSPPETMTCIRGMNGHCRRFRAGGMGFGNACTP